MKFLFRKNGQAVLWILSLLWILALTACGGSSAAIEPPTIIVLNGDVQSGSGGSLKAITPDQKLGTKDMVVTAADSRALLTYTDGSTIELEPETEITLVEGSSISLSLAKGMVWAASSTDMQMSVDAGGAVASAVGGTGFSIEKSGDAVTVKAVGGTVKFKAGNREVEVANGQMSTTNSGEPGDPVAMEPQGALRLYLEGEAFVYLADPAGRAIGFHPTKEMVTRQIPGAWYSGMKGRPQVISVPDPLPGKYTVLLVAAGNQSAWKMDIGVAGTTLDFSDAVRRTSMITWGTPTGITVDIFDSNGSLSSKVGNIWTLYEAPPGIVSFAETLKRKDVKTGEAPSWAQLD